VAQGDPGRQGEGGVIPLVDREVGVGPAQD
jgi:hypothetical protein